MMGVQSVVLFWKKDSFWRRETEHQKNRRILNSDNISKPVNATKMEEMASEGPSESTDDEAGSSSQTRDGEIALPEAMADPKDKEHVHGDKGFVHMIEQRLRTEWLAERNEAISEAAGTKSARSIAQTSAPSSAPATPGGTRVRWEDHT